MELFRYKIKKNPYILGNETFFKIKKVLIFSQKKLFLYFRKRNCFKKTSYISGGNFPSSKD